MKNRIRDLRKESSISIAELANKLGVSERSITAYETGERDLSTDKLKKLALIFNCSTDYILKNSDIKSFDEHEEYINILFKAIKKGLKPSDLESIIDIWLNAKEDNNC